MYDPDNFDHGRHAELLADIKDAVGDPGNKPQHLFIAHFYQKYSDEMPPSWMRLGMNPGHLYYQLAQQRGFKSTRGPNKVETKFMVKLADEDPERFDRAWDLMAKAGHL